MNQQLYYVPKESGTLSDLLLAFGAAELIAQLVKDHTGQHNVVLTDQGGYYVLDAGVVIEPGWIDNAQPMELIPFVTSSKIALPPDLAGTATRNVDQAWDNFRRFTELQKQLREQEKIDDELKQMVADLKPAAEWTVVTYLGDYRMQAQGIHNNLVEQWVLSSRTLLALNLRTILALLAAPVVDREVIIAQWKKAAKSAGFAESVTASQLFNPHMGKGQNRAKANGLTMGNEVSFWLLDFLKAVGLWSATAPRVAQNAELRKTYVLAPKRLALRVHKAIFPNFLDRLWNDGAVKLDIQAALLYADQLLAYSVETEDLGLFSSGPLADLVAGMGVATYQLLSANSYTLMNLAFIGLPNWLPAITTLADVRIFQEMLAEHLERIRAIDEDTSEGNTLLVLYRNFVSGNDLHAFFAFCASYSNYLISALERSRFYVKPFSELNLRRLIEMTEPKFTPILQNRGFLNIAKAIRRSTVIPQYIGRKNSWFDIHYGLGQELKRKSQYSDDFIQVLCDFMQSYNDESARVAERSKGEQHREAITTEDIGEIIALIDDYGSKTICNLLVAFGYARDPKEKNDDNQVNANSNP